MKKLLLLIAAFVLLGVLVIVYIPFTPAAPQVGADKDTHGCIASAGYTYSVVRNACIRLWEEGTALTPVVQIENPVLVAYVVQSQNGNETEVFLPDMEQGLVFNRIENEDLPTWAGPDGWTLTYDTDAGWKLAASGEVLYTAPAK